MEELFLLIQETGWNFQLLFDVSGGWKGRLEHPEEDRRIEFVALPSLPADEAVRDLISSMIRRLIQSATLSALDVELRRFTNRLTG